MSLRYLSLSTIVLLSFMLFVNGCKKDNTVDTEPGSLTVVTSISGIVLDVYNTPVAGARVTLAGTAATANSNSEGIFAFSNVTVPKDRFVVNVSKSNYFDGSVAAAPKDKGNVAVQIYLVGGDETKTISASDGGTIETTNGTGVELSPNSVQKADGTDFNGNVKMTIAYLDPTSENFSSVVPGGDLRARRTDNTETNLYSYGIIKVDLQDDSGVKLKLKSQSKITVDIPPSMEATAPATIPLWHYDATTGLWKEEGTATKQGDKYVGNVTHFSDWNCDVPGGTGTVKGLVVDCNNLPVQGVTVKIGQGNATTGIDGKFERRVPINVSFQVQVMANRNFGLSSTPIQVSALSEGAIKDVGTINIDCPAYVTGLVKCGAEIKYGQVVVSWQGGYNSQYTDSEGKFKIAVDINKNAQLSVNTFDGKYKSTNVSTPTQRGATYDIGTIEVCDQIIYGENKFTLNGDGFNNQTYTFTNDTLQVFGYYEPDDTLTFVWMNKVQGSDTVLFWITFKGTSLGAGTDPEMVLMLNRQIFWSFYTSTTPEAFVNISKYGGIGGLIEGSFNGKLYDLQNNGAFTTLSAGKFSVIRVIADNFMSVKSRIPKALRKQLHLK